MWNYQIEENILYEDKEILVCRKTAGMPVQAAKIGTMDMESALKNYLAQKTPGKIPYLGVVHRLDQPVEGILVFAKTSEAAGNLSKQMMAGGAGKYYLAVTEGKAKSSEGILTDYLKRKGSEVVNMLTAEYDYETDIEVQRGEAYDKGREEEKKNLIKNLYEAKFTVAEISKLLKTKEDEVEKIINC